MQPMFHQDKVRKISILIISESTDPASNNIKNSILKQSKWEEINTFDKNPVYQHQEYKNLKMITINDRKITHENLDIELKEKLNIKPDHAIFISKHTSKTGEPTLTTHPIGNYGKAEFGGQNKTLVLSSPKLMSQLLRIIKTNSKKAQTYHKVCFEATHHGPYLNIPSLFVEVGSTEEEWNNKKPVEIIANSVLELLNQYYNEKNFLKEIPTIIGLGGGHYAPRFTDVALERNVAFGHMIPKYQIDAGNIDEEMFEKAIQATPEVSGVYIHRKSLKKSQVTEYKNWFEQRGIPPISSKDLPSL